MNTLLKKYLCLLLACLLAFSCLLAGCGEAEKDDDDDRKSSKKPKETTGQEATQPEEPQPESTDATEPTPTVEPPEATITLEDFVKLVEGVWVYDGEYQKMDNGRYSFTLEQFNQDSCVSGWYPGEYSRPGIYEDFQVLDDNVVRLELKFAAGEYMMEYYEESRSVVIITFQDDGTLLMDVEGSEYEPYVLFYGGKDPEEANQNLIKKFG